MSEAGTRLRNAVRELKRTKRGGRDKTGQEILDDQYEYDAAMREAKEYAAANPSVTDSGFRGWTEVDLGGGEL